MEAKLTPRPEYSLHVALTAAWALFRRDTIVTLRDFIPFLLQSLIQPLFYLFIFGTVLPHIGIAQQGYGALLLPGIVALTLFTSSIQGVTVPLALDLGFGREIDDRLLAPLPVAWVAIEKVLFAALRGLISGAVIFPLAWLILGREYQVRADAIGIIIGVMVLTALAGSCIGLLLGTLVRPDQIGLMFALVLTPLLFTGCVQYPWGLLHSLRWFQLVTLLNPITYAAEGLRFAMVPAFGSSGISHLTLPIGWVLVGLTVAISLFLWLGIRKFLGRVVS